MRTILMKKDYIECKSHIINDQGKILTNGLPLTNIFSLSSLNSERSYIYRSQWEYIYKEMAGFMIMLESKDGTYRDITTFLKRH